MVIMLCEELELNGIEVISANTDGIVVKLYKSNKAVYDSIISNWKEYTKMGLDSEEYKRYVNRDINNFLVEEINGKVSYKGALNPKMYLDNLQKGYSMPIVAEAVSNYFIYDKPILETLYECTNILDFCITQNIGRQFHVEYIDDKETAILQKNVRFYASNSGGYIYKVNNNTYTKNGLCAGQKVTVINSLDDKRIEYRDIDYKFYYNEALKIIDPIKLGISPNLKGDRSKGTKSGKSIIKQMSGFYNTLFDDEYES